MEFFFLIFYLNCQMVFGIFSNTIGFFYYWKELPVIHILPLQVDVNIIPRVSFIFILHPSFHHFDFPMTVLTLAQSLKMFGIFDSSNDHHYCKFILFLFA